MGKYFGTDGFRAEAGEKLSAEISFKLGCVLGVYFSEKDKRPRAVIGKDTRLSSYMLEYAIAAGLASVGADVHMLHVITTPGVAYATKTEGFDIGIMISASHNPYYDNGIKVIGKSGEKINDKDIEDIEKMLDSPLPIKKAKGDSIGKITDWYAGRNRYIGYLISLSKHSFKKFKIGLDTANGASFMIAKSVFESLGAEVHQIGNEPNGTNINLGVGSTAPERLASLVKERGLDVGFAFDGDADRCIAVDENGEIVGGDKILYILSVTLKKAGELSGNTVVTTVMSNLGLYKALDSAGIQYIKTKVGDRFVYEAMQKNGYVIGAEQSGHLIISKYLTGGDGILTAIKLMEAIIESKESLATLSSAVSMLPQRTASVRVKSKSAVSASELVNSTVREISSELGQNGRILIRESGTEPVIRVMAEAKNEKLCEKYLDMLVEAIILSDNSEEV